MNIHRKEDHGLPKKEILRRPEDFQTLIRTGRFYSGRLITIYYDKAPEKQVGFVVSKRLGNAVFRNRFKRLMKEAYRIRRNHLTGIRILMMARKGLEKVSLKETGRDLEDFLNHLKVEPGS